MEKQNSHNLTDLADLADLADFLQDICKIIHKFNMLDNTPLGQGIFIKLFVHYFKHEQLSMKDLNADIEAGTSTIRPSTQILQKHQWIAKESSADDLRVQTIVPSKKLEKRLIDLATHSQARILKYMNKKNNSTIINKDIDM